MVCTSYTSCITFIHHVHTHVYIYPINDYKSVICVSKYYTHHILLSCILCNMAINLGDSSSGEAITQKYLISFYNNGHH